MRAETEAQRTDHLFSVRVFGGVGVDATDRPVGIGGPRQQRLLALLVIRHGQVVTNEWLAEYLWTDEDRPDAYPTRLRTYVSRLRQSLPEDAQGWIETEPGGYRLVAPLEAIEHVRFTRLRAQARDARDRGDPLAARELLDEALALWRGEPFRELEDLDWARADIEQLHLDRLDMLEERWETELALGRHTQITGELGSFVGEQPLRERAVRQYALALHRSGRTPEALRILARFRRTVADETGLDPSPAFVELERSLLDGDPSLEAPAGRPLRGYRLLEEVGAGAFAVVWRATQPSVDRDVAIKQIRSELATRPEFIRRFEAEARLVARVEHPHIVPLIDYWRDPDSAYLVMRWLGGDTLQRRLDDGPLSVGQAVAVAEQIGGALSAAHAHGVVHRDVKPSNILFDAAGHAYLTDFGIALGRTDPDGPQAALSPGSPAYAPPEQLRGDPVGPDADVFSLAVVVHECLVGSLPPRGDRAIGELLDPRRHEPFSELRERIEGIPSTIVEALERATEPDPADRFAGVDEFVRALRDAPDDTASAGTPTQVEPSGNPYVGLRPFDDGDADRFFGRGRLIDEIVGRLSGTGVRSRCVVVVGPSGSGKSSVVRAGVVPALRRGAVPGSSDWFTTTMVPGGAAYESLEAALLRIAVNPPASLLAQLRDGERGILRSVRRCVAGDRDRVTVVIDQFEELFTTAEPEVADRFLTALSVAVEDPSTPLRLIATIRADYYDRPLQHPLFARILKEAAVEITPLAADELVEAIIEPARRAGVGFEPGLVARVSAETFGRASPLPLLQYALSELFDRRASDRVLTVGDYDAVGGITGALAARAETLYLEADAAERAAIRSVFGRLTNPNDVDTRVRIPIADLGDDAGARWVLERFGRARLLTFDRDDATREPTVEVAHEALLREWPRAATWHEEDRELRRTVGAIGTAASTWDRGGRQPTDLYRGVRLEAAVDVATSKPEWLRSVDHRFIEASHTHAEADRRVEQRRIRRLRRLVAGTAIALVVALIAGSIALTQQRRADREARAAEDQAAAAEAATAEAELAALVARSTAISTDRPEVGLLLALEALHRSPGPATERNLLDTLAAGQLGRQVAAMARLPEFGCRGESSRRISPDGLREFGTVGDELVVKDLVTGATTTHGEAPESCVSWFVDSDTGLRLAESLTDFTRRWTGRAGGAWTRIDVGELGELLGPVTALVGDVATLLHPELVDGRLLFGSVTPNEVAVTVVDPWLQEPAASDTTPTLAYDYREAPATAASPLDGLFAVGGQAPRDGDPTGEGLLVVLDATTGSEVLRERRPSRVTAVAFDTDRGTVLAGGEDGMITVIDVAAGAVIAEVETSEPLEIVALGTRPDGGIVAVSPSWIELFDPAGARVGPSIPIPASDEARVRPDGTVVVVPSADPDTIRIIDPTGGPLVEHGFTVEPDDLVIVRAGRAGVVDSSGSTEIVELATGNRVTVSTALPGGRELDAVAIAPETDGFLAWDSGRTIARWRGDRVVEQLELWSGTGTVSFSRDDGPYRFPTAIAATSPVGDGFVGAGAATVFQRGHALRVYGFDPAPGNLTLVAEIRSPPVATVAAVPGPDGGVHLLLDTGVVRSYRRDGSWTDEIATNLRDPRFAVVDPATGAIAVGGEDGAAIVDPSTTSVQPVADVGSVVSLGFAREGSLLVVVEGDGTVRLWDTVRAELVGTLWTGSGTASPSPPWYDESTDTIWVATSGAVLQISLDPERWVDRVCGLVTRELTPDEWDRLVPGDVPPRPACG